ncbi:MAG: hypothetical protein M1501_02035 [Candidatus Omnitrophica bacterium]|nr:hypothetical protein [Candidatus Omnitrophota bacterium]
MKIKEPKSMEEIHEIREKMYYDDKTLTIQERIQKTNDAGLKILEKMDLKSSLCKKVKV